MKKSLLFLPLLLMACTPGDEVYCNAQGLTMGTLQYEQCKAFYFRETARYNADFSVCGLEADKTYPQSLYDDGRWQPAQVRYAHNMGYGGGGSIFVVPDAERNAEVDRLRMRIIGPCMQKKGWKNGSNWREGRIGQ
ncbi:MAG: hypothetical protein ACK529_07475 [Alphaproteobacteria bacterium]